MLKREGLTVPVCILGAVLVLLTAVGTFFDYPISEFLYPGHTTAFGDFFAAFGELPAYFALHSAGIMLIRHRGKSTRFKDVFFLLGGIALFLLGILGEFCEYREDLPQTPLMDAVIVTLVLFLANTALTIVFLRSATREDALRFVMAVLFVCVTSMLAANLLKFLWNRPRMRFLAAEPAASFVPWYQFAGEMKKHFASLGVRGDEFRSFPSGHTVTAAASILWTLYPTMHRFFEGKGRLLFLLSLLWTIFVTVSRLTMGAHFLTDVSVSWLFTLVLYIFAVFLFYRDGRVFQTVYKLMT